MVNLRKLFKEYDDIEYIDWSDIFILSSISKTSYISKSFVKMALWYTPTHQYYPNTEKSVNNWAWNLIFCYLWWWRFCIQGIWATMNVFMWFMSYFERLTLIIFTQTCFQKRPMQFWCIYDNGKMIFIMINFDAFYMNLSNHSVV